MPSADSALVAKLLVKADLRGYPGHGVTRIPSYLSWIKDGTINLRKGIEIEREGKISAVIEGNHTIGQVAAKERKAHRRNCLHQSQHPQGQRV